MPEQAEKLTFEASAYLQTLIGRELFRSRELAVVELVKNAYDSGARNVFIRISLPTEKRPSSFQITDDGTGMDLAGIKRLFMVAGYSEKSSDTIGAEGRIPTGEKGIGRFASDRLGSSLQVETKIAGQTEGTIVPIDWNLFNTRKKRFNQIGVPYYRRPLSFLQKGQSGTRLTITQLREQWDRAIIEELRRVLAQLFNPFDPPKNFRIDFDVVDSDALSGPIQSTSIVEPDFDVSSIKPIRTNKLNPFFKRGEAFLLALDVLREATEPLRPMEIAIAMLAKKGVPKPTAEQRRAAWNAVKNTMDGYNGRAVTSVGHPHARRWRIKR